MKTLRESLLTGEVNKPERFVTPRSNAELKKIIKEHIANINPNPGDKIDFNWIDISKVKDLSKVFKNSTYIPVIDKWKIDHVRLFVSMFEGNQYIQESPLPRLQKHLNSPYCYSHMFYHCASLRRAPELPATELTENCYEFMFASSGLIMAPKLPAKKLAKFCYNGMFRLCSRLSKAPDLPATQLEPFCYEEMFSLSGLTQAPYLPATSVALVYYCYREMFAHCHRLTKKAKTPGPLGIEWADKMYEGCPCE